MYSLNQPMEMTWDMLFGDPDRKKEHAKRRIFALWIPPHFLSISRHRYWIEVIRSRYS